MTTHLNVTPDDYFSNLSINVVKIKELIHGFQSDEKNIYLFYGDGNNGKTTLALILKKILKDECMLISSQPNNPDFSKKLLIMQEIEDWSNIDSEILEEIAYPYNNKVKCKLVLITNTFQNQLPSILQTFNDKIERIYFPNDLTWHKSKQERQKWYQLPENQDFVEAVKEYLQD